MLTGYILHEILEPERPADALAYLALTPLGSLLTGFVSARLGLSIAFIVNGLLCLAGAIVFGVRLPRLRLQVRRSTSTCTSCRHSPPASRRQANWKP